MSLRPIRISVCVCLLIAGAVHAQPGTPSPAAAPPGGDPLSLDQYYGDSSQIGSFPGKLVCIASDVPVVPENATACGPDKIYALAIDNPEVVVPLIGSARAAADKFPLLLDKAVVVRGKHYPDKKLIAAASIESAGTAADAPDSKPAAPKPN